MKQNSAAAREPMSSADTVATRGAQSSSWDPYDVWLTRIQQPRDSARRAAADSASADAQIRID